MSNFDLDDSDNSIIHQDSDDDEIERDDDVDIGFRHHQFRAFDNEKRKRQKEENLFGVFYQEPQQAKRFKTDRVPMFVAASTRDSSNENGDKINSKQELVEAAKMVIDSSHVPTAAGGKSENSAAEEERKRETKIREEQKAADDYFVSLLDRGRINQSTRLARDKKGSRKRQSCNETSFETTGLGGESGVRMISSFGSMGDIVNSTKPKMQSNLGKWEKHTKGIGSKLLAKMGWSGEGGLGSNRRKLKKAPDSCDGKTETADLQKVRKGISRPVEVVVRPASLGLGFGNFKESSQLKTNREIEAEVRGLETPSANGSKQNDDSKETVLSAATRSSAVPGADEVLAKKQWKRKRKAATRKLSIVPYEDLLAREAKKEEVRIVDMTGQEAGEKEKATKGLEVQLGAEILHNVSFMVNMHETKLHSSSHFLRSIRQKRDSFQSDVQEMKERHEEGRKQMKKLKRLLHVGRQVETLAKKLAGELDSPTQILNDAIALLEELAIDFSGKEKDCFQFWDTVSSAILSPLMEIQLDRWNPLQPISESKHIIDMMFGLAKPDGTNVDPARIALRNAVVQNHLLPRVKKAFDSTRLITSQHTDLTLDLYEYILKKSFETCSRNRIIARDLCSTTVLPASDEGKGENFLAAKVKKMLIFESLYPNLQRFIRLWKPMLRRTDGGLQVVDRLDLWIVPWLPHLDHPTVLPKVIADCQRKIKYAVEVLLQKSKSDAEFLSTSMDILRPWRNIFDSNDLQNIVSEIVTPRLARYLAKQRLDFENSEDITRIFGIAVEMHHGGLISDIDFLSLVEGEVLIRWAASMRKSLLSNCKSSQYARRYVMWKRQLLTKLDQEMVGHLSGKSSEVLQDDGSVCQIFWSVLWMLQLEHSSETQKLSKVSFPTTNFQVVAARRAREKSRKADEQLLCTRRSLFVKELETHLRLQPGRVYTPTFREVVEEFAKNRGIPFQPRVGSNTTKDGRQIFTVGKASIFFEGDVIFALKGKEWFPVALDKLATCLETF